MKKSPPLIHSQKELFHCWYKRWSLSLGWKLLCRTFWDHVFIFTKALWEPADSYRCSRNTNWRSLHPGCLCIILEQLRGPWQVPDGSNSLLRCLEADSDFGLLRYLWWVCRPDLARPWKFWSEKQVVVFTPAMWSKHRTGSFGKITQLFKPTIRPLSGLNCVPYFGHPPPQRSYKKELISDPKITVLLLVQHTWREIL